MRYVITGGTGHIGNTLTRLLREREPDSLIRLLLLPGEDTTIFRDVKGIGFAYGDVLDRDFLMREIEPDDVVFHLAGIIDISSENKDRLYEVNVQGVKNVADVCLEKGVAKLIYASSVHAIPPLKGNAPMSEPHEFNPEAIVGDYAKSKVIATKYVFDKAEEGLRAVVVYPTGIVGPNDYKISNTGHLILDIVNGDIKARVNGGYNFADVRDVAQGIYLAAKLGRVKEGYILGGHEVTVNGIFAAVDRTLRRRKYVPFLAIGFVKIFAGLAELYYKVRKQKPLFTKYSLYTLTSNHNFCYDKAKTELGYTVRDFEETIGDSVMWFYRNRPDLLRPEAAELVRLRAESAGNSPDDKEKNV